MVHLQTLLQLTNHKINRKTNLNWSLKDETLAGRTERLYFLKHLNDWQPRNASRDIVSKNWNRSLEPKVVDLMWTSGKRRGRARKESSECQTVYTVVGHFR